jgi:hypothetical protein
MGRPLNKKYFGSLAASNIGGESVASVTITGQGNYASLPTVSFSPPALPGGVSAVGSVVMELRDVTINNAGGGYAIGDVLVIGGGGVVGDTTAGTYTVQAQIAVASVAGPGDPTPGAILTFTALSVRGAYTALPAKVAGGSNTTNLSLDGGTGNNARVDVTWRVLEVSVTTAGSGYISVADALPTFSAGTATATGAAVLTSTTEPAITPYAVTIDGGTVLPADIIKQTGDNNYIMETTEGQTLCTLGTTDTPVFGGAYLLATDANGSTYYVTKLTAHLAVLVQKAMVGSYVYQDGDNAPWSLEAADNLIVQVNNT